MREGFRFVVFYLCRPELVVLERVVEITQFDVLDRQAIKQGTECVVVWYLGHHEGDPANPGNAHARCDAS